ncbi:beta-ketoacyl-[acyl-carrier-protein] synthase family protein [Nonomuraea purpurea]|uniref:Beta-ketoacyl-[acyl-carrier-protein] synthase family protein n=1 Tax=Nonomuraea purpurea TaxID=1849276 RepID=A0ABV8GT60_9ACTN
MIAVSGLGLVTPAGIGAGATWQRLLTGRPTATRDPDLDGLPVDFSCRIPDYDILVPPRGRWRLDRFTVAALAAAREAVADARLDPGDWQPDRVGVVTGTGTGSMERYLAEFEHLRAGRLTLMSPMAITRSISNMVPAEIALALGARGPNFTVSTACASGATAISVARDLIRSGTCDIVITGGSESVRSRIPAACFHRMGALSTRRDDPAGACRPFHAERDGFVLSEGAAVLILERDLHARARGVQPYAYLAGSASTCDSHHFAAPHPDGDGLATAMTAALREAGLGPGDVGHVNAHGTGTRLNDAAEHRALHQVFTDPPPVTSLKGTIGHAVGASAAIEAACTALSLRHQVIPPTANLDAQDPGIDLDVVAGQARAARMSSAVSSSSAFGGQNTVLVFHRA